MKLKVRHTSYLLSLGLLFTIIACQKKDEAILPKPSNHQEEEINSKEEMGIKPINPGEALSLDISGRIESFKEDETRSFELDNRLIGERDKPLSYTKSVEKDWGIFYFKKIGSKHITKRILKYSVIPIEDDGSESMRSNQAKIKILVRPTQQPRDQTELTLDHQESFSEGEWYISGILGQGETLKSGLISDQKFNSFSENAPKNITNPINWGPSEPYKLYRRINAPIKLKWSKLKTSSTTVNGKKVGHADAQDLRFGVEGALLSIKARSDLFDDVRINGINIKSSNLSFKGHYREDTSTVSDEALKRGDSAPYVYEGEDDKEILASQSWNVLNANFFQKAGQEGTAVLRAGTQSQSRLKLLVMPITTPTTSNHRIQVAWSVQKSDQQTSAGLSLTQELGKAGTTADRSFKIEAGNFYKVSATVETDLIISEVFNHNPEGYNYGWTELYNGTLHDIDLSDYALGRSTRVYTHGHNYYVPFPSDVTGGGKSIGDNFGQAMVLPLSMESFATKKVYARSSRMQYDQNKFNASVLKTKWWDSSSATITATGEAPPTSYRGYYWGHEKIYVQGVGGFKKDTHHSEDFNYIDKPAEVRRILPPGKTIIILNYGYFVDKFDKTSVSMWHTGRAFSNTNKSYLHGIQMARAYKAGYCHDIIMPAHFSSSFLGPLDYNNNNYRINSGDYNGPVNHKADADGMFLVRRYPNGKKKIIDSYGPLYTTKGVDEFYNGTSDSKFIAVRGAHILFPDKTATRQQWNWSIMSTGHGGNVGYYSYPQNTDIWTSAGTRYKHEGIRPNWPDVYDGQDQYVSKTREW